MSQNLTNPEQDRLGPVDCVVVEFPGGRVDAAGFQRLLDLVDRDVIRILDLEFLAKQPDGGVVAVPASELSSTSGFDVGLFDGAASNLLDRSDIDRIANDAGAGSIVAVLIYEERSLVPIIATWEQAGGRVIADNVVTPDELLAALDATESA